MIFSLLKSKIKKIPYGIFFILLFPALFINLGYTPYVTDEANRAMVSFEMQSNHNLIVPTINNELYFKKPPLYNWIIYLFQKTGGYDEVVSRIPTVLFLLFFCVLIYFFHKNTFGKTFAFTAAALFLTTGRILFYESNLGLFDMGYSCITYLSFIVGYFLMKKEKILLFFILTYLLSACAFLIKGFPTIIFQFFTIVINLILFQRIRLFFNYKHFLGIICFVLPVSCYYWLYSNYHSPIEPILGVWDQAERRTGSHFQLVENLIHYVKFPFDVCFYHFAPWTILVLLLGFKSNWKAIFKHEQIKYCFLLFLLNIIVYWISPQFYPRFILMLIPLLCSSLLYLFIFKTSNKYQTYFFKFLFFLSVLGLLSTLIPLFFPFKTDIKYILLKSVSLFVIASFLLYLYVNSKSIEKMVVFACLLLLVRIGFNWFVIPEKSIESISYRNQAIEAVKKLPTNARLIMVCSNKDEDLSNRENFGLEHQTTFYLERELKKPLIIKKEPKIETDNDYFILLPDQKLEVEYDSITHFYTSAYKNNGVTIVKPR